jgi:hypothetical protein
MLFHFSDLQASVVAAKGLGNQISLNKLLCVIGTQVQLEALSQSVRHLGHAHREAGHL